jgi:glc operon protein GlcG
MSMRLRSTQALTATLIALLGVSAGARQAPAPVTLPGPTLAEAKKAIAAAQAAAAKMGVDLSCVVLDARGAVVAMERMDKAPYFTPDVARGKALVSASFGAPSGNLTALAASGILEVLPGRAIALQGAVPIVRNNQRFGAVGCSGGTGQQDEDGAKAGAAAFQP